VSDKVDTEIPSEGTPEGEEVVTIAKPKNVPPTPTEPLVSPSGKPVPEGYHLTPTGQVRKNRAARVKGSKITVADVAIGVDAELIANTTEGLHAILAELVDPKCALTHEQAKIEGEAIARVMEQYQLDPQGKYLPWVILVGTLALCETPTIVVIANKVKTTRENRPITIKGELLSETPEGTEIETL
jgi:hypothetical protein